MQNALFPGSFDPITIGHYQVIIRAKDLFEKIIVAVGNNTTKTYLFPLEQRIRMVKQAFAEHPAIEVTQYEGLTVDFCRQNNIRFLLRGIRNSTDFEFEKSIALMNQKMAPEIETVFLLTDEKHAAIHSTIVREIYRNGGDIRPFLPQGVIL